MTDGRRRPHIVLILTDDHAAHAISAYGSRVNETPHIDALADRGWRLDRCLVTNSLCSPSRASILTGTYSHVNGVTTLLTPIEAGQPTMVDALREAGYRTAVVGKWHLGHGPGHDPEGFDYYDVLLEQGEYWDPTFRSAQGERTVEGYATDLVTDLALRWADDPEDHRPMCLLVWHKAPHRPWQPKEHHRAARDHDVALPATFFDDYDTRSVSARRAAMRVADHLAREDLKDDPPEGLDYDQTAVWKYQRFLRDYLACIDSVDENVGRVVDWLAERGELDDTLLVYASDQGFFLGDHGWFDKRLMYEESLRMPLVLSYPAALEAGRSFDGIVTNVDLAPTLLEAAGVAVPERMQGRSFWPDLLGVERERASGMYYRYWLNDDQTHQAPAHYGYRTERHKLIYFYNDGCGTPGSSGWTFPPEWELYDLEADPQELRNVYHDPAYRDVRERLTAQMWDEQARLGDVPHPSQAPPTSGRADQDRSSVAGSTAAMPTVAR